MTTKRRETTTEIADSLEVLNLSRLDSVTGGAQPDPNPNPIRTYTIPKMAENGTRWNHT